jgi:transglutaminase-like putative cysteine protease
VNRAVSAELTVLVESPARLAVQIAVADATQAGADEDIAITVDGQSCRWEEVPAPHGGRLWVIDVRQGLVGISYTATLTRRAASPQATAAEELTYLRPSRFCESDRLAGFASRQFRNIADPKDVLAAVSSWVGTQLEYVSGSSGPTDGAVDTLLAGRGVCRDFAHLAVALLRSMEIPARLAAVYAPGLDPMDFHAVAEAAIDGAWYVVDATLLAPRETLVRITTGRDASDTSFLSTYGGRVDIQSMTVGATVDGDLPIEDVHTLVQLG